MLRFITAVCICVAAVGCTTDEALLARIADAERISEESPAEAVAIMRSIDRDDIYGEADNARYALVYSEALYRNGTPVDSDSLTQPMMMYYLDDDNHDERVRALYQHALVAHAAGRNGEAMYALIEAERSFDKCHNLRCKGLIHRTKGEIYNEEWLFDNALESFTAAKECFDKANLPLHSMYAQYDIALTLLTKRSFNEAEEIALKVYRTANYQKDTQLIALSSCLLCRIYIQIEEYSKCRNYLPMFATYSPSFTFYHDCFAAVCSANNGDIAAAESLLNAAQKYAKSVEYNNTLVELEVLDYATCILSFYKGDIETSYAQYQSIINHQDDLVLDALGNPLFNAQVKLFQRDLDIARQELEYKRNEQIYIAIILTTVILLLLTYLYYRHITNRRKIEAYLRTIQELQLISPNRTIPSIIEDKVNALYSSALNDINQIFEAYYEHNNSSRHSKKVLEQVSKNIDALRNDNHKLAELEQVVNHVNDNAVEKLRKECTSLTNRDLRIIVYSLAGFTTNAICLLIDTYPENLYKIKHRLRNRIRESGIDNSSAIIEKLYRNKH